MYKPIATAAAASRVALRLPRSVAGMALATSRWLRRLSRIQRLPAASGMVSAPRGDRPLPGDEETVQRRSHGVGGTVYRRYRVRIAGSSYSSAHLLDTVATHLNAVSPVEVADFK